MKSEIRMTGDRVEITRVFHAQRHIVFGWWSRPEKLQKWSGCKDATRCEIEMDFRVGGGFTQKMQIAGAGEFTITGTYLEIVEPERIVYQANLGQAVTRVSVEFFEEDTDTKVVLTHEGLPGEFFCKTVSQGTDESFDKLEPLVGAQSVASSQ
jgi:uncharacterized protein YndB with AHSA1/START domain